MRSDSAFLALVVEGFINHLQGRRAYEMFWNVTQVRTWKEIMMGFSIR
jgi:hypothetical protein